MRSLAAPSSSSSIHRYHHPAMNLSHSSSLFPFSRQQQRHRVGGEQRTPLSSLRSDFITNLNPHMQRERVGSGSESSTRRNKHTTSENRDDDDGDAPASSLSSSSSSFERAALTITPRIESNKTKSAIVTTSQPRVGGGGTTAPPRDDHSYGKSLAWDGPSSNSNDDDANDDECIPTINRIVGTAKTNNDGPPAPSTTTTTTTMTTDDGTNSITKLLPERTLSTIKTYPLRVIEQLRLCERIIKQNRTTTVFGNTIATAGKVMHGLECIHCVKNCSTAKDRFRKFPMSPKEVGYELVNFRNHLMNECRGVPTDLQDYISWMEEKSKKKEWYRSSDELRNIGGLVMTTLAKWEQHYQQQTEDIITSRHHTMRVVTNTATTATTTTTTTTTTGSKRMKTTTMEEHEKKARAHIVKRKRHHHHSILEDLP